MRAPRTDTTSTMTSSVAIILLVMAIGAVIFLRQSHYMRRRTAQVTIAVLLVALVAFGFWTYHHTEY